MRNKLKATMGPMVRSAKFSRQQNPIRRSRFERLATRIAVAAAVSSALIGVSIGPKRARAAVESWTDGNSSTAWQSTKNWAGATVPGSKTNTSNTDIAVIPFTYNSGNSPEVVNLFSSTSNTGSDFYLGAIVFGGTNSFSSGQPLSITLSNSQNTGSSSTNAATLWLNGASDPTATNGATVIIYDAQPSSDGPISIQNGTSNAGDTLTLGLNTASNLINLTGGSNAAGAAALSISSNIIQSSDIYSSLTINANSNGAATGGVLTLAGANSYSAGTIFSNGTLIAGDTVQSTTASSTGIGSLTLNNSTLASSPGVASYVLGPVVVGTGANVIAPGGIGAEGTLDLGSTLSLNGDSTLSFDISGHSSDLLAISGTLSLTGTPSIALSATGLTGNYVLASYAATSGLSDSSFTLPSAPSGYTWDVTSTEIELNAVIANATLTWAPASGTASGTWDTVTQNWTGRASGLYINGDNVNFNDIAGSSNGTISVVSGGVQPGEVYFGNTAAGTAYTLDDADGTNGIGGSGAVTLNGTGTVTFTNPNSYSGGTVLNGGVLRVSNDNQLGASGGGITFGGGTLQTTSVLALGSGRTVTVNSSGGTFDTNSLASTISGPLALGGTLNVTDGNDTGNLTLGGAVTVSSGGALSIASGTTVTLAQSSGTINFAGGNFAGNLIISTPARVNFNSGSYTGSGQIQVVSPGAWISNASGTSGATLQYAIVLNPGGGQPFTAGSGNFVTTIGATTSGESLTLTGGISGASDVNIANSTTGGGAGTLYLDAASTYTGQTLLNSSGTISLGIDNALPTTTDVIDNTLSGGGAIKLDLAGFNQTISSLSDGSDVSSSAHNLTILNSGSNLATLTVGGGGAATPPASTGFSGYLSDGPSPNSSTGANQLAVNVTGGTLKLNGSNAAGNYTYSGGTTVTGGTLLAYSTDSIGGSTGSGPVTVSGTGMLGGKGNILGIVNIESGGTITAGNASTTTGLLTIENTTTIAAGSVDPVTGAVYRWKINDAGPSATYPSDTGAAGQSTGWDELTVGTLAVAGSGQVTIDPLSLNAGASGAMADFDPAQSYRWAIATFSSATVNGITLVNPASLAASFHLDSNALSAFAAANGNVPTSDFSLSSDAGDLYINYAPVPEPGSLAMFLVGAGGLLLRRNRRSIRTAAAAIQR